MFNNTSNLYGSEWLANIFANRNQLYGAYMLRKQSSVNLVKAFVIVVPLFVGAFILPKLIANFKGNSTVTHTTPIDRVVNIENVIHDMVKEKPKPITKEIELPAPKSIPVKVKSVAMSANIKVVKDDLVTLSPPTSNELKEAVIGSITQDGTIGKLNAEVGNVKDGVSGAGGNGTNTNEIHDATGVDVFPEFPGGMSAWSKYIQKNLRYPISAQEEGVQGKVFLSFVVEKDGTITDVKVLKGIGYGCDDEAVRVIKKSPRWKVGMQNNLPVRVRYNMPISYMMSN